MPRPSPEAPPVTMATWPARDVIATSSAGGFADKTKVPHHRGRLGLYRNRFGHLAALKCCFEVGTGGVNVSVDLIERDERFTAVGLPATRSDESVDGKHLGNMRLLVPLMVFIDQLR